MDWLRRLRGSGSRLGVIFEARPSASLPPEDRGFLGQEVPRASEVDESMLASAPAGARTCRRTAYLAETEPGAFGSGSGFGGRPFLPEGVEHPVCTGCGRPMRLLAQLDTASLPSGIARGEGLLQLFYCGIGRYDDACDETALAYEAFSPMHVQCLVPRSAGGSTSTAGDPSPSHRVIAWRPVPDIPDHFELQALGVDPGEPPDDVVPFPYAGDKLGGWPRWVQDVAYPDCPECGSPMGLVLQIESERTLPVMFGDMGIGHLTQCPRHPGVMGFAWASS